MLVHDLAHMEKFVEAGRYWQQVGFFEFLRVTGTPAHKSSWAPAYGNRWRLSWNYVSSDMNAVANHMMNTLKAQLMAAMARATLQSLGLTSQKDEEEDAEEAAEEETAAEEAAAGPEAGARRRSSRGSVRKERGRVTLSCGQLAPPLAPHEGIVSAPPPPQLPAANAMQAAPLVTEPAPPLCQPRTPVGGPIHAQVGLPRSPPRSSQSSNLLTLESALEELVKELQSARIIGPGQGQ